jgi:uncharacterized protein involved in exopolysaccharide biosynthesis
LIKSLLDIAFLITAAAWRRRFLIIVPVLLLPPIGYAIGLHSTKTYESRMTILVQEPSKESPYLDDLALSTRLQERMPVLKSLVRNPQFIETAATDVGLITPTSSSSARNKIIDQISAGLSIELVGADLVDLRLRTKSIRKTDQLLTQIAAHFVDRLVGPERSAIAGSVTFLAQQVDARRAMVKEAEELLTRFTAEHAEELPEAMSAQERMASLRRQLDQQRASARSAKARLETDQVVTSLIVGGLDAEIAKLTAEASAFRARYTDRHPALRDILGRLEALEQERERAARAAASGSGSGMASATSSNSAARADYASARVEVAQLEEEIERMAPLLPRYSDLARQHSDLENRLNAERQFYENLVKRYEMARVTGDLALFEANGRVKIIDPPEEPKGSALPPYLFLVAGIVAGIGLGSGLAVLAELGDSSIRYSSDVERVLGLRVLARLPNVPEDQRPDLTKLPAKPTVLALEHDGSAAHLGKLQGA